MVTVVVVVVAAAAAAMTTTTVAQALPRMPTCVLEILFLLSIRFTSSLLSLV
jgi:hypothetical protein